MPTDRPSRAPDGRWSLTQESFDSLLAWLDSDRERAGRRYEEIRRRLIKIFACRGCHEPEDLADETINRVAKKVADISATYEGDPALYFYGVANKVHLESVKKRPASPAPPAPQAEEFEREHDCLERCMELLPPRNRELVLQYYHEERGAKIEHRQALADQLGIALNALRIRAHRIRMTLRRCVEACLAEEIAA